MVFPILLSYLHINSPYYHRIIKVKLNYFSVLVGITGLFNFSSLFRHFERDNFTPHFQKVGNTLKRSGIPPPLIPPPPHPLHNIGSWPDRNRDYDYYFLLLTRDIGNTIRKIRNISLKRPLHSKRRSGMHIATTQNIRRGIVPLKMIEQTLLDTSLKNACV